MPHGARNSAAAIAALLVLAACASEPAYGPPIAPPVAAYAPPPPPVYAPPPPPPPEPAAPAPGAQQAWRDGVHQARRIAAVDGYPEFAREEAAIRATLDAGVNQGWLDHDDYLIFGRQLHQTELREARQMRLNGGRISHSERVLVRNTLEELRRQLDETRRER